MARLLFAGIATVALVWPFDAPGRQQRTTFRSAASNSNRIAGVNPSACRACLAGELTIPPTEHHEVLHA